jgi:uncharacterized protein (TIGR02271 family)
MNEIGMGVSSQWIGRTVVDRDGEKIGKLDDLYTDRDTRRPEWLAVTTGLFGTKMTFVPATGATDAGGDVMVRWRKDQVKDAPRCEADGELSEDEEARLYAHYGLGYGEQRSSSGLPEGEAGDATYATGTTGDEADDRNRKDDAMTRSEEELDVGTRSREAGRARLRKWVETEHAETTVPVSHDEVRVEREAITDANIDRAMDGPEIRENEYEVVLEEEEAVVNKRVQPKERVRLETETVTEQETVGADLRKERVEVENEGRTSGS